DAHPYNVYGGLQDNGSWRGPAETFDVGGIRNLHWQEVAFGDGFDTVPDPVIANTGYAMSQGGNLSRWNLNTGEQRSIRPNPPTPDTDLRFNWSAGFAIDPFEPSTIYYGSQFLHKSTDKGLSWSVVSDDLTTDKSEWQTFRTSGGITFDVTAAENFTTIIAVAPSRVEQGVIWVGTDDGRVHVTRNGGETWNSVEGKVSGVPDNTWVPMIYPSPHDAGTAFVVFDNHRRGDFTPYIYRSENYGESWDSLADDAIKGYVLSVLQDPRDSDLLWAGTEFGLFVSLNAGDDWTRYSAGVPTSSVMDLAFQERENDLVIGTHGRAIFVLDDVSPLRGLSAEDFDQRFALLGATDGQQYDSNPVIASRFWGNGEFTAPNEAYGVMLTFMASGDDIPHPDAKSEKARKAARREAAANEKEGMKNGGENSEKPESPRATITVADASGNVIRTFTADVQQGINRVVWDLRRDGLPPLPGSGSKKDDDLPPGIEALPGTYQLTVAFDDMEASVEARVLADPRSQVSMAAMAANQDMQLTLQSMESTINQAIQRVLSARQDLATVKTLIEQAEDPSTYEGLQQQVKAAGERLDDLEADLHEPKDTAGRPYGDDRASSVLRRAQAFLTSTYDAPSPAAEAFVDLAAARISETVSALNDYLAGDHAGIRAAFGESDLGLLKRTPVPLEAAR
ncbi:MAG: hypothetical protein LC667_16120, partial [Thioalkalivibrio sp.]|nr:hypothetical protein [Thioalkalivibrio sp.]